ncbi:MAG: hypothetical protein NZ480_07875 [Bdellovibrionaceae bacterium]|nr:hypothetical protein [Pseudobdellovibrionaceae bacterium]MDW8189494.1 diacylglycerol kinase family protein [Pseudobdellovibrionaceae bacterium]
MKTLALLNQSAGSANIQHAKNEISDALFRFDIEWVTCRNLKMLPSALAPKKISHYDRIIILGGDGTINRTLMAILSVNQDMHIKDLPPLVICPSGTANDLASNLGIPRSTRQAARVAIEGDIFHHDVIEVIGENVKAITLTNGGFGIPAFAAQTANDLKSKLNQLKNTNHQPDSYLSQLIINSIIKKLRIGPEVYILSYLYSLINWDWEQWGLELTWSHRKIITKSPIVLLNNHKTVGHFFKIAPFTRPNDGQFNVSSIPYASVIKQLIVFQRTLKGLQWDDSKFFSFETSELKVKKIKNAKKKLYYFGDGEILAENATELEFKLLPKQLKICVPSKKETLRTVKNDL